MTFSEIDMQFMSRALELAARGQGYVEPNPMVGCAVVQGDTVVGEGWHQRFGGPHAEIEALRAAGPATRGATLYVTLEPCCHHGKTPPCADAVIAAGIRRTVIAHRDPFEQVDGGGIKRLTEAGIDVETGLLEDRARRLNAPYLKLIETRRPWMIAKWAMTLDGKIATRSGQSKWISNEASRAIVHQLRGRVDAIVIGRGTAEADNPLLTARPPGARTAMRIVLDSRASLSPESQLVRTAAEVPVLIAAAPDVPPENRVRLEQAGCEVLVCDAPDRTERLDQLLDELGRRRMTNVLVEGGGTVLGSLLDCRAINEVHIFIAPILLGGTDSKSIGSTGSEQLLDALHLDPPIVQTIEGNVYVSGRIGRRF